MDVDSTRAFFSELFQASTRHLETGRVLDSFLNGVERRLPDHHLRLALSAPIAISGSARDIEPDLAGSRRIIDEPPAGRSFAVRVANRPVAVLVARGGRALTDGESALCEQAAHHLGLCLSAHAEILNASVRDPLTGLLNRRFLELEWPRCAGAAHRYGHPISLALIDLDGFRDINRQSGHTAGDDVLRRVGQAFAGATRSSDVVVRYGGDEFAVILPRASADEARMFAERLNRHMRETVGLTASIGLATWDTAAPTLDRAVREADRTLCAAKAAGGNRCAP